MTSSSKSKHPVSGTPPSSVLEGRWRETRTWLTSLPDWFLSEHLRQEPPHELNRRRMLVGSTLFMLVFTAWFSLLMPFSLQILPAAFMCACCVGTLLLVRRARSFTFLAVLLCGSMAMAYAVTILLTPRLWVSVSPAVMLIPAFAVFMLGPRVGLAITLPLAVYLGVFYPLYRLHSASVFEFVTREDFLVMYGIAAPSLVGAWVLSSLHSTSRNAVLHALEQTLLILRESEGKLISLVESTDDLVFSLDSSERVIIANAAMRELYRRIHGEEFVLGQPMRFPSEPDIRMRWEARFAQALQGQRVRFEEEFILDALHAVLDVSINPVLGPGGRVTTLTVFARDITARKVAETQLGEMHRHLVEVSRYAGMAEIATGVLHNVGNTLNSVNTSAGLLGDRLRHSRVGGLRRAATLLREHSQDLGLFLSGDARGQQLPGYFLALADEWEKEREFLRQEAGVLSEGVEHIKSIVSMQQRHARAAGVVEQLPVPRLIEEALRLHAGAFERQGIRILREYAEVPPILVDRHNLLQILVNLMNNARDALMESPGADKQLRIRIRLDAGGARLVIELSDNGVGLAPEHLMRVFSQGFTTKKHGHGFGLHISALAASTMGGQLSCASEGLGQGATFSLVLPVAGPGEPSAG